MTITLLKKEFDIHINSTVLMIPRSCACNNVTPQQIYFYVFHANQSEYL